ncbi:MAG: hypothetical protein JWL97_2997 [Gemmatimonadales bacterium]|nr:hypothetical protein [Gemmatimonadales bacterium]
MLTADETRFTLSSTLIPMTCWSCGVVYGLEKEYRDRRVKDGQGFFCPNGHTSAWAETEAMRLRKQLQQTESCLQNARNETQRQRELRTQVERSLRGTKAVVTRMKRCTVKGQCVCCSRKFKDLEKHMQTEHPGWNPDKAAEALAGKA